MRESTMAPRTRRSSGLGWCLVVLGLVIPPLGLIMPTVLAVLGYIRVWVAIFATAFPLLILFLAMT